MAGRTDLWLENLVDELDGAALYDGLAEMERDPARRESFRHLADGERRHAEVWAKKLTAAGIEPPPPKRSTRTRVLLWLARRLGTAAVLPLVVETETGDADKYARQGGDAAALVKDEEAHRAVLVGMEKGRPSDARSLIGERERWHRTARGGAVRAAIFGMNDGIVSNLSLVLGVAGAGGAGHTLVVTGLAGLLAGACSMAVGEYTSVASQRDLQLRQIEIERREIQEAPEEEAAELALILKGKGLSTEHAVSAAADMLKDPVKGLDTLVREELGLNPEDLGSPVQAAASSFGMFSIGALIPLVPLFFGAGRLAPLLSAIVCAVVLGGVGALIGVLSGMSGARGAARMVGLAALAAGITFVLGRLVGGAIG